jgi:hypothetical protein
VRGVSSAHSEGQRSSEQIAQSRSAKIRREYGIDGVLRSTGVSRGWRLRWGSWNQHECGMWIYATLFWNYFIRSPINYKHYIELSCSSINTVLFAWDSFNSCSSLSHNLRRKLKTIRVKTYITILHLPLEKTNFYFEQPSSTEIDNSQWNHIPVPNDETNSPKRFRTFWQWL